MKGQSFKYRIESKLFNGYVLEPIPMFFFVVAVGIALLTFALWATYDVGFSNTTTETVCQECVIEEYRSDGPIYRLKTNHGVLLDLPTDSVESNLLFEKLITDCTPVLVEYILPDEKEPYSFDLLSIFNIDGTSIISSDQISTARAENSRNALLILWGACLCYVVIFLGCYYILCHAPKYPRMAAILIRAPFRNF